MKGVPIIIFLNLIIMMALVRSIHWSAALEFTNRTSRRHAVKAAHDKLIPMFRGLWVFEFDKDVVKLDVAVNIAETMHVLDAVGLTLIGITNLAMMRKGK